MSLVDDVLAELHSAASPAEHAKVVKRVGDPDRVVGVRMRDVFDLASRHVTADLCDVEALLVQPTYEARMVGVSILDAKARSRRATQDERRSWARSYLAHHDHLDLWDFVDRAAPRVLGGWLLGEDDRSVLDDLAASPDPMRRRSAITACFWLVRSGELRDALRIADRLADDPERLVLTSVGVGLREVGRRDPSERDAFLADHPRLPASVRRVATSA